MKLLKICTVPVVLVCLQAVNAHAFENEPDDFRGVAWGSAYDDYASEMSLVRTDADVLVYVRNNGEGESGRDNYMKIAYRFYKDRFSAGIIQTYGKEAKRKLQKRLAGAYGEPVKVSRRQELYAWDGENVQIVLSCSVTSYCAAEFMSKEMIALEERETGRPVQVLQKDND